MYDSLWCDLFFFSSRRRHTRYWRDWSSDVCSSDLTVARAVRGRGAAVGDPGQRLQREARDIGGAVSGGARYEPDAAGIVLPPGVEVPRAAVGPTRSVGCGHRVSSSRPVNRKARSVGSGPGGLLLSRLRAYAL